MGFPLFLLVFSAARANGCRFGSQLAAGRRRLNQKNTALCGYARSGARGGSGRERPLMAEL